MKYDFTSILDRRGRDAWAVDGIGTCPGFAPDAPKEGFDAIPMWVADMNFPTVPTVPQAIIERAKHPAYGYFDPPEEYYDAIIRWHEKRNGVTGLTKECIGYENGVLGGVISALNVLCSKGDNVLLHSPTYVGFTNSLSNNGYNMVLSPLVRDEKGIYRMDFEDMERKIVENRIHATVFCSPHNPCGRVWEHWELEKFTELCAKHNVFIVSDEIWSDILRPGVQHIPTQSVNEDAKYRTIAVYAPSKTFNLAGLIGSYHIIYCPRLQDRVAKESSLCHYNDMNVLSMHALLGAYQPEGYEWCDELRETIAGNVDYACDYITKHFEGVEASKPEGTYMLFVDCTKWCETHGKTIDELEKACWDVGVAVQDGRQFHGPCHIRMNLALPLTRVKEAFDRLDKYVFNA
ncbi:aminotransferase [Oscillospiraceae bacterium]|nr:aminotransferase [Oscillospiraceae bacterium]